MSLCCSLSWIEILTPQEPNPPTGPMQFPGKKINISTMIGRQLGTGMYCILPWICRGPARTLIPPRGFHKKDTILYLPHLTLHNVVFVFCILVYYVHEHPPSIQKKENVSDGGTLGIDIIEFGLYSIFPNLGSYYIASK